MAQQAGNGTTRRGARREAAAGADWEGHQHETSYGGGGGSGRWPRTARRMANGRTNAPVKREHEVHGVAR